MTTLVAKTVRGFFALCSSVLLAGCATSAAPPPIRTMEYVDLDRWSGEWFVLASIPTVLEQDAFNAVEIYDKPDNGVVQTTFRFNKGALDGDVKEYRPKGFVTEGSGGAVWGMQFVWPIKAEYRILYVDEDYEFSIVGRSKRDFVWIMARDADVNEAEFQRLLNIVEQEGYDLAKIRRVPHQV